MTKKVFTKVIIFRKLGFAFSTALIILGVCADVWSQNPTQAASNSKESVKETNLETEKPQSRIKVTFDETTPGVLIIESNGEKIRVDATRKTVEPIAAASEEKNAEPPARQETAEVEASETQENQEESIYDFDSGQEPYDYRLVNIPTPKKVPKGTWNISFTHRFTQPIHPISDSGRNLLGFDSFSVSAFGVFYGITDKLYVTANRSPLCQRGLCRAIEVGVGYNWLDQDKDSPVALTTYASIEGNGNFTEEYTYNLQAMASTRLGKRVYLFFSPAVHLNSNGQRRFNPRPNDFFPPSAIASTFELPAHTASFGFGASVLIRHDLLALFDFTPRTGFKLGRVEPVFNNNFNLVGFRNVSHPTIGFGIQKNIGNHAFALTFSNTQTTTTSRYNSSNLLFSPKRLVIGFNLFRRF